MELRERTKRDLDAIAAEFHGLLPRKKARLLGAIYARYSSRYQDSIADQVRKCYEAAIQNGIFVPREFICYDVAVRGYKRERVGLDQLQALLEKRAVNVLLVFATNRLFRKTYRSLQFVEEEVVGRGIRCVFASIKLDTADSERWQMQLQFHGIMDELVVGMYADNVRAAHEGMFLHLLVVGTIAFGYKGESVPGLLTKRNKPRQRLAVDPDTAKWVTQVFGWYVKDLFSIAAIVQRLNADPDIPLPPKAITGMWTELAVRGMLVNPKYRGLWEYGKTKSTWLAKQDYRRQIPRQEPLKSSQFEELRIIPDELWYAAQKRLAEDVHANAGRKPRDGDRKSRPRLTSGLFWCAEHKQQLYVGGAHGKTMYCPVCKRLPRDERPLYSLLNRELALRLTCNKLIELILADAHLVENVVAECQREAESAQRPDPGATAEKEARLEKVRAQIQFLLDNPGETEEDRKETAEKLKEARRERNALVAHLGLLQAATEKFTIVPSAEEVRSCIRDLGKSLAHIAVETDPAQTATAREIIKLLTGGRIELVQQGERRRHCGWLQGRFKAHLLRWLVSKTTGCHEVGDGGHGIEVVIDYREQKQSESLAEQVHALWTAGLTYREIAVQLDCGRALVTEALSCWHRQRGLEPPDGRSSRKRLQKARLAERLADQAKGLWDTGLLMHEIADCLKCSRDIVTMAIRRWHELRGLDVPDGRTRRKSLTRKTSHTRRLSSSNRGPADESAS